MQIILYSLHIETAEFKSALPFLFLMYRTSENKTMRYNCVVGDNEHFLFLFQMNRYDRLTNNLIS